MACSPSTPTHWLVADCGNTDLKLAVIAAADLTLLARHRLTKPDLLNHDRMTQSLEALLASCPHGARIGMVWSRSLSRVSQWLAQWGQLPAVRDRLCAVQPIEPGHLTARVNTACYAPGQLGADRVANLVATAHRYPARAALVVDFGTATSLNLLDAQGVYQGGLLLSGWETYAMALSRPIPAFEEKLAAVLASPLALEAGVGQDTLTGLRLGLAAGYAYQITGSVQGFLDMLDPDDGAAPPVLIATGGLVGHPQWPQWLGHRFDVVEPELTLLGLALLAVEAVNGG